MNRTLALAAALCLLAAPGFAQKVTVDWDKDFDFESIKTYQWAAPKETPVSPLMLQRVEAAIQYNLAMRGIERVEKDAEVFVTYHAKAKDEVVIHSDHFGYGYGRGWGRWGARGMGASTTRSHTYTKGSLIFDIWSAKTKNMIYRGTITDTVSDKPEKNEKKINKGAEKLFEEFDKQYNKEMKKKGE
jgi:hypothetical protein